MKNSSSPIYAGYGPFSVQMEETINQLCSINLTIRLAITEPRDNFRGIMDQMLAEDEMGRVTFLTQKSSALTFSKSATGILFERVDGGPASGAKILTIPTWWKDVGVSVKYVSLSEYTTPIWHVNLSGNSAPIWAEYKLMDLSIDDAEWIKASLRSIAITGDFDGFSLTNALLKFESTKSEPKKESTMPKEKESIQPNSSATYSGKAPFNIRIETYSSWKDDNNINLIVTLISRDDAVDERGFSFEEVIDAMIAKTGRRKLVEILSYDNCWLGFSGDITNIEMDIDNGVCRKLIIPTWWHLPRPANGKKEYSCTISNITLHALNSVIHICRTLAENATFHDIDFDAIWRTHGAFLLKNKPPVPSIPAEKESIVKENNLELSIVKMHNAIVVQVLHQVEELRRPLSVPPERYVFVASNGFEIHSCHGPSLVGVYAEDGASSPGMNQLFLRGTARGEDDYVSVLHFHSEGWVDEYLTMLLAALNEFKANGFKYGSPSPKKDIPSSFPRHAITTYRW